MGKLTFTGGDSSPLGKFVINENATLSYKTGQDKLPPPGSSDPITAVGLGMPITIKLFRAIVNRFIVDLTKPINPAHIIAGTFGKESIMHILSQEGCEGIRWIHAKIQDGDQADPRMTIALIGVDKNNEPLPSSTMPHPLQSEDTHRETDPVIYEVSGGTSLKDVADELGIDLNNMQDSPQKVFAKLLRLPID